jgi:hypothetical protein
VSQLGGTDVAQRIEGDGVAERHEIVFGEATRLLARQEANLDTLRVRSLGVLTAGGVIAGLAGVSSGQRVTPPSGLVFFALIVLAFMAALAVWIQWPADFDFSHDIRPMITRVHDEPNSLRSLDVAHHWAQTLDDNRKGNKDKIDRRMRAFTYMCVGLGLEVLAVVAAWKI